MIFQRSPAGSGDQALEGATRRSRQIPRWWRAPAAIALSLCAACTQMEPRWLLERLPGDYPDVVYFFPVDEPLVALTIDDGPDPEATAAVLDLLAAHDARATFFFLTDNIPGNEDLVTRAVADGHELGNHLTADEVSAELSADDFSAKLAESSAILSDYGPVRWFRPGSAWYNEHIREATRSSNYRLVEASMIPLDARVRFPGLVAQYIRSSVEPGSILVLHTRRGRGPRTVAVLQRILPDLKARGFRFVTLTELATQAGLEPPPSARKGEEAPGATPAALSD
jgi:peptidoglycan/xylan/chitin deacetylase (PgdA/CDA1 family)